MVVFADIPNVFCGELDCKYNNGSDCSFAAVIYSSSCLNHAVVITFDLFLLFMFILSLVLRPSSRETRYPFLSRSLSSLQILSILTNTCLCMIYLGLGLWNLVDELTKGRGVIPLHQWLVMLLHGLSWMLTCFTLSLPERVPTKSLKWTWLVLSVCLGGLLSVSSILEICVMGSVTVKIVADILFLPAVALLLLSSLKRSDYTVVGEIGNVSLHMPLNGKANGTASESSSNVSPYESAGLLSRITFWWLNPLMKRGCEKVLDDNDIPLLCEADRSETCHVLFTSELNKQKQIEQIDSPSVFWTIVYCHWKEILISGVFALVKIVTLSCGPVLLNAFINFAEKDGGSIYEGCGLALSFFLAKCLESVSQRQWYFRSRMLGVRIRSLLCAEIFWKQLRLSNSAKLSHSSGEIMNYVTVDAYRIGEFPFWFHQTWTTSLQICIALVILFSVVGLATISAMVVIVLTVASNIPLAKLQHKFQTKLMKAQDVRLKAMSEALVNMKVLKLYAWETHFKMVIEGLRKEEHKWLKAFLMRRAYNSFLFWTSPVLVSAAAFGTCYLLGIPLNASNVFTFVATVRILQDPVRSIPDVIAVVIQAKVAFTRIVKFLDAPELHTENVRKKYMGGNGIEHPIVIKSAKFSWEENQQRPTLKDINLEIRPKDKVAICGEVGSGKSTLLAAILGEIPNTHGQIQVSGKIAYVSQTAWIPQGTIQKNILFGSPMDKQRYHETLEKCSLVKDLDVLPYGDLTEIGERGVNLSGGQKQRLQLARALYQDADIYLLDDPFSAVDAHTATSLFNDYVMDALSEKTVLLVTHQVDFLPAFNSVLLMSNGEILHNAPYYALMHSSRAFQDLVNAHKEVVGSEKQNNSISSKGSKDCIRETNQTYVDKNQGKTEAIVGDQLIKKEERETGDTGLRPYMQYLNQNKGFLYFSLGLLSHIVFVAGQISQNSWMAANVQNPEVSQLQLITVYLALGFGGVLFLVGRSIFVVVLGLQSSQSLFLQLLNSLFRAPMMFFDSTPLGRILSRVSTDLSIVDLDLPFTFMFSACATLNTYSNLAVLAVITWQVLFVSIPMVYLAIRLQKYYYATGKELMRINGTTKSIIANHLAESISGATTIRAFEEEKRFFDKCMELIDKNASPFFHIYIASEWLMLRLELMSAAVLSSTALAMVLLPQGSLSSGFIGMALSYGLSLNNSLVFSIQNQCTLANYIISVERLNQYMNITSEAPEVLEDNRPPPDWPAVGRVEIQDLKIRYRPDTPLVLHGLSCTFEGGSKIGIVGRTGSGKTTLISALFRLIEPAGGKILIDGIDITTIGLHDLRSRFAIIPQDPTLFNGTIRYNLDPLEQYTDQEIWEVLEKCQLKETLQEKKEPGLDSPVIEDGLNWSLGQRQLFCLCRALLRRSRILVLDEATASIDNATDSILQKTIRAEFANSTVITVAHRIPTVMDCTMVLAISDGKLVEFDRPEKLMQTEGSLFQKLVNEYWSHALNASSLII